MTIDMLVILTLVVLLSGISKAAFAGSLGLLAMPLMLIAFPAHMALGLLLPILIMQDTFTLRKYWQRWSVEALKPLLPAAILGVITAAWLLNKLSSQHLQIIIGTASILFALRFFLLKAVSNDALGSPVAARILGFTAGVSSTLVHAGGPPMTLYLLAKKLPGNTYIASSAVFFALLNIVKLPAYVLQGQLTLELLWWALPFAPLCYLAIQMGYWIKQRITEQHFLPIIYSLLLLTGIRLLWQGLTAL